MVRRRPRSLEEFRVATSSNALFSWAVVETQGQRDSHEDAHSVACSESLGEFWLLDGHRGAEAAHFGAEALPKEIGQTIKGGRLPSDGRIQQGFRTVDNRLRKHLKQRPKEESNSGSTVVGALIAHEGNGSYHAKLINCGDSRGIIIKDPKQEDDEDSDFVLETVDHKPDSPQEKARVMAAGGVVRGGRRPRIDGRLAVSRALGDFEFKADRNRQAAEQKVSCEPDIYDISGLGPGTLLLLACDGVWDVMSSRDVAALVREHLKVNPGAMLGEVAESIVRRSFEKGSGDNLTVLLVHLANDAAEVAGDAAANTPR
eukprot:CAMPEP_0115595418 /NCGR_PEP_ID=MMETSP0272-20121206/12309_1 /TAXON_ID=71861 /ORGANISM="Scrippsiella trochoidea, Strain CCMP3099" /LENGTH=314 /DNA_ID=CAMNT_0003030723 /DNA_START=95 /DNA_END=1036 /DNA_ORIENTATION=+